MNKFSCETFNTPDNGNFAMSYNFGCGWLLVGSGTIIEYLEQMNS